MTKFIREKALVEHLLDRLGLNASSFQDPNVPDGESGIDVKMRLSDGRSIGVQVTEIDPFDVPGSVRAQEKAKAKGTPSMPYGMYAQNDRRVVVNSIARTIQRKVKIAERHSFPGTDGVWLLICAGVPEHGAVASTFVMTTWLSVDDMNLASNALLQDSKYTSCFFLPILGPERAHYHWERTSGWEKSVEPRDVRDAPREAYVQSLLNATSRQERDRLLHEECQLLLQEMRRG